MTRHSSMSDQLQSSKFFRIYGSIISDFLLQSFGVVSFTSVNNSVMGCKTNVSKKKN